MSRHRFFAAAAVTASALLLFVWLVARPASGHEPTATVEVQLCDLPAQIDQLEAKGSQVVAVLPGMAMNTTDESDCPCGQISKDASITSPVPLTGGPCIIGDGWRLKTAIVVYSSQ
jgi:hypothetical protein